MMFDMTGVTRQYVEMEVDYDGVEYTGPDTLLEYTVSQKKEEKNTTLEMSSFFFPFLRLGT